MKPSHLATWARATNGRTAEEGRGDGQTRDRDLGPNDLGENAAKIRVGCATYTGYFFVAGVALNQRPM